MPPPFSCGWLIQNGDAPILLTLQRLDLEHAYDTLNVYDGSNAQSTLLGVRPLYITQYIT